MSWMSQTFARSTSDKESLLTYFVLSWIICQKHFWYGYLPYPSFFFLNHLSEALLIRIFRPTSCCFTDLYVESTSSQKSLPKLFLCLSDHLPEAFLARSFYTMINECALFWRTCWLKTRHGKDNKLIVWRLSEEDEQTMSIVLPVDTPPEPRKQPWILHVLDVNTMNFCSFAQLSLDSPTSSDDGDGELLIAVPNTMSSESVSSSSLCSVKQ